MRKNFSNPIRRRRPDSANVDVADHQRAVDPDQLQVVRPDHAGIIDIDDLLVEDIFLQVEILIVGMIGMDIFNGMSPGKLAAGTMTATSVLGDDQWLSGPLYHHPHNDRMRKILLKPGNQVGQATNSFAIDIDDRSCR